MIRRSQEYIVAIIALFVSVIDLIIWRNIVGSVWSCFIAGIISKLQSVFDTMMLEPKAPF